MSNQNSDITVTDPILMELLRGRIELPHHENSGLVVLVRGKPGTGKSTLAIQLLDMLECAAWNDQTPERHYCTMEQSTPGLAFKVAFMRVAQALEKARYCDYGQELLFRFNADKFFEFLKKRTRWADNPPDTACTMIDAARLLLYGEPKLEDRKKIEELQKSLAGLAVQQREGDRIQICSAEGSDSVPGAEEPIGHFRSRVVLASHMLDKVLPTPPTREGVEEGGASKRQSLPIVVVDGLSLLSVSEREQLELQKIVELLRRRCQIGILVYEPNRDESASLDHHADMVIELERREIQEPLVYLIHELCIRKARYQETALGKHQFKIRNSGIALFPSLHFQVQHYNYMDLERTRSGDPKWEPTIPIQPAAGPNASDDGSVIDLIFNPAAGDSVVLLGSRNSFKTQLCLDFMSRGSWGCPTEAAAKHEVAAEHIEQGLLVSLIDNRTDIEHGLACPWKKHRKPGTSCDHCDKYNKGLPHARPFCQRPGCITPSEFFHYLKEVIERRGAEDQEKVRRLVFWDLTQMDYRFPLFQADKMLLPALMDFFKTQGLKSLFMGAGNAENTKAASAMADHVLFCWRSRYRPRRGTLSSLMLYVDRTSASTMQSGKALYCIPVYKGDKLDVPRNSQTLNGGVYKLNLLKDKIQASDREQIEKITNMQGVA